MKIKVQGKTYEVSDEFKNLSKKDQQKVLQNIVSQEIVSGQQANTRQPEEIGNIKGLSRAALGQGLLFGFGDELEAGVRSGFGLLSDYGDKVKDVRQEIADYQALNPGKSISAELGGAVIPTAIAGFLTAPAGGSGGAAVGAGTAARIAARAPSIARQIGQGAKVGAGYGGVYGVGTGQSEEGANIGQIAYDRAMSGLKGAAIGGTVGGVMQPAISGGIKGIGKLKDSVNQLRGDANAANRFADRKILQALNNDGSNLRLQYNALKQQREALIAKANKEGKMFPDEVYEIDNQMSKIADNINTANPGIKGLNKTDDGLDMTIADTGEAAQRLAYAANSMANTQGQKVVNQLVGRQNDQAMRIVGNMHKAVKTDPNKIGVQYIDDLAAQQSGSARLNYPEAYKTTIPVSEFKSIFGNKNYNDLLVDAAKRATKILKADGKDVPDLGKILADKGKLQFGLFDDFMSQDLSTEFFHAIKMGMDDIIDAGTKVNARGQIEVTRYAQKVLKTKNKFNDIIKANNKQYAEANKQFSDKAKLIETFNKGEKIARQDIRSIEKTLNNLNPGEKEAFKNGIMSYFTELAEKQGSNQNFINKIFNNEKNKKLFKLIMDPKDYKAFEKYMAREGAASKTLKDVLQGSPTATRQQAQKELGEGIGDNLIQAGNRGLTGNLLYAGGKAVNKLGGVDSQRAALISEKLFATDPATQRKIVEQLMKENEALAREVARNLSISNQGAKFSGGAFGVGVASDPNNPR